jgi:hypothetical protein
VPEPRHFHTLEELNEYFNLQLSRVNLEPAPLVRKARAIELAFERDAALAEFRSEQERAKAALEAKLTPPPPRPEPEPLSAAASDDEHAARLYGQTRVLGRKERAPATKTATSPEDQVADDEAAAKLYGGPVLVGFGTFSNRYADRKQSADFPPTPGDGA